MLHRNRIRSAETVWQRAARRVPEDESDSNNHYACLGSLILTLQQFEKKMYLPWYPTRAQQWRVSMKWNRPKVVEIALGAEINSYACAVSK